MVWVGLHIVVHALDHMVTGGTQRQKILILFLGGVERANGRKPGGNFVVRLRINRAAALPLIDFFHCHAQFFRREPAQRSRSLALVLSVQPG